MVEVGCWILDARGETLDVPGFASVIEGSTI